MATIEFIESNINPAPKLEGQSIVSGPASVTSNGVATDEVLVSPDSWVNFEPRMVKHIQFARTYADEFNHGAPGHLDMTTIAALSRLIDALLEDKQ